MYNIMNARVNGWVLELQDCDFLNHIVGSFGDEVTVGDVVKAMLDGDDFYVICRRNRSPEASIVYAAFDKRVRSAAFVDYACRLHNGKIVFQNTPSEGVGEKKKRRQVIRSIFKSELRAYILNHNPPQVHIPTNANTDPLVIENRRLMLQERISAGYASEKKEMECEIYFSMKCSHTNEPFSKWHRLWLSTKRILICPKDGAIPLDAHGCRYF